MKPAAYISAFLVAAAMAAFHISTESADWVKGGLVGCFYLGGVFAFLVAGDATKRDAQMGQVIFILALALRAYTYAHAALVVGFGTDAMYELWAGNSLVLALELYLYSAARGRNETEDLAQRESKARGQVQAVRAILAKAGIPAADPEQMLRAYMAQQKAIVAAPAQNGKAKKRKPKQDKAEAVAQAVAELRQAGKEINANRVATLAGVSPHTAKKYL